MKDSKIENMVNERRLGMELCWRFWEFGTPWLWEMIACLYQCVMDDGHIMDDGMLARWAFLTLIFPSERCVGRERPDFPLLGMCRLERFGGSPLEENI